MSKNPLLENLLLLAILQRKRNRRKKLMLQKRETRCDKIVSFEGLLNGETDCESDDSLNQNVGNYGHTSSDSCSEVEAKNLGYITAFSFDKYTKDVKKTIIHRDHTEFKEIRELTNKIINRRVICDICGKSFSEKSFKFHLNKHNNNFPYKCIVENCKKAFTSAQMLKQHQKFHSKEKRFTCEFCDRAFYMPSSLKKHRLLHFDPTIECQECEKMFHTTSSLKIHMEKIHVGIKKFVCSICDRRYFNQSSLRKHLIATHKQEFTSQRILK